MALSQRSHDLSTVRDTDHFSEGHSRRQAATPASSPGVCTSHIYELVQTAPTIRNLINVLKAQHTNAHGKIWNR